MMEWIELVENAGAIAILAVSGKYILDQIFQYIVIPIVNALIELLTKKEG